MRDPKSPHKAPPCSSDVRAVCVRTVWKRLRLSFLTELVQCKERTGHRGHRRGAVFFWEADTQTRGLTRVWGAPWQLLGPPGPQNGQWAGSAPLSFDPFICFIPGNSESVCLEKRASAALKSLLEGNSVQSFFFKRLFLPSFSE